MPKVKCLKCGDIFKAKPANVKKGKDKFCSGDCWRKYQHDENYVKIKCRGCDVEIEITKYKLSVGIGVYHSRECFVENMGKLATDRNKLQDSPDSINVKST